MKDIQIDDRKRPRKCGTVETSFQLDVVFNKYFSKNDIVQVFEYDILGVSSWADPVEKYAYKVKLKYGDTYIDVCKNYLSFSDMLSVLNDIRNTYKFL